ncbi:MAG TPA: beta-CASP ribonuclease aCPSF1 [Acidobacteriota bacterium]|nr:beta-CASP ribonuclease aCPSF1 [Acidobacteriota bacterium]
MTDIIKEILKELPKDIISFAVFEGANIVLYTKKKEFFLENQQDIKAIVDKFKKRIELRPDPSICMPQEKAEKKIRDIMPEDAELGNIIFDPQRSCVIIESEKPGQLIGKQGSVLNEIREKTTWVPSVRRTPMIRSQIIEDIRSVLYANSDERRQFLNRTGERIYNGWIRSKKQVGWIRLSYLGSGRQVGRSCILLQTDESRVLLDCGIDPGIDHGPDAYPMLEAPEFKIEDLDAVIVSHAHLDHVGFLPYLFKFGFRGPVYCTEPTRDVMALSLIDFVKIMNSENEKPLYGMDEIREMVKHTVTLDYDEVTDVTPDVRITFHNAGHIIGSSVVHIHIGNGMHNLVYSADIKYGKTRLLDPAVNKFTRCETLMIEATYGGKANMLPSREEAEEEFAKMIMHTIMEKKGKVLIPVLGVGRAQEIMLILEMLVREGKLTEIPVYIDGMVWDMTAIHTAYPEFLNADVRKQIFQKDNNPFMHQMFKRVGSSKERIDLVENQGPCVILATSGMLVGGASVEYFRHLAEDPKHSIIFVSYQGEGSLGRRVQRGERSLMVSVNGRRPEQIEVKMEIFTIDAFTGHSDRNELMNYVKRCSPSPRKILTNHGEASRCLDLAASLHRQFGVETISPKNLDAIRIR